MTYTTADLMRLPGRDLDRAVRAMTPADLEAALAGLPRPLRALVWLGSEIPVAPVSGPESGA